MNYFPKQHHPYNYYNSLDIEQSAIVLIFIALVTNNVLNNVEELGRPERTGNMIVPPLKIRDFTFTSLSDAV